MRRLQSLPHRFHRIRFVRPAMILLATAAIIFNSSNTYAEPPFAGVLKKTVGAGSASSVELKPEHGPWLIFATSFDGPKAKEQAEALAMDLQRDHNLPAFVMPKKFDYTELMYGSGIREDGSQKVMKYRDSKVVEGYAVLVGEFDSTDSPSLNATLKDVKTLKPKSMVNPTAATPASSDEISIKGFRNLIRSVSKGKTPGPLETAFVTRNPMLPVDFFQAPDMEKFVHDLNRDPSFSEHSLLDCKGKYTIRVLTFRGEDKFISWGRSPMGENQGGEEKASPLEIAAEQAHLTTKALRAAGYEAYQFHDRTQSIVTVGSFESLGTTDSKNQFNYDRGIQEIVQRFGPTNQTKNTNEYGLNFGPAIQPRLLFDLVDQRKIPELNQGTRKQQLDVFKKLSVGFDVRPTPMAVPRYQTSRIYAGARLGGK